MAEPRDLGWEDELAEFSALREEVRRAGEREVPPASADAAILAASRRAVGAGPRPAGRGGLARWRVPLAAAAVVVVAASLSLLVFEDSRHETVFEGRPPASAVVPEAREQVSASSPSPLVHPGRAADAATPGGLPPVAPGAAPASAERERAMAAAPRPKPEASSAPLSAETADLLAKSAPPPALPRSPEAHSGAAGSVAAKAIALTAAPRQAAPPVPAAELSAEVATADAGKPVSGAGEPMPEPATGRAAQASAVEPEARRMEEETGLRLQSIEPDRQRLARIQSRAVADPLAAVLALWRAGRTDEAKEALHRLRCREPGLVIPKAFPVPVDSRRACEPSQEGATDVR